MDRKANKVISGAELSRAWRKGNSGTLSDASGMYAKHSK